MSPERIDRILGQLRTTWKQAPDLRLGQLLVNALGSNHPCPTVFYAEDKILEENLARYEDLLQHRLKGSID